MRSRRPRGRSRSPEADRVPSPVADAPRRTHAGYIPAAPALAQATPAQWDAVLRPLQERLDEILRRLDAGEAAKSHLTVAEFAVEVGLSSYRVRAWIKGGRVRATKVGGVGPRSRWLIPREELTRLLGSGGGVA